MIENLDRQDSSVTRQMLVANIITEIDLAISRIYNSGEQDSLLFRLSDDNVTSAWRLGTINRVDFNIQLYLVASLRKLFISYHSKYTGYMVHQYPIEISFGSLFENRNLNERYGWSNSELTRMSGMLSNLLPDSQKRSLDE